MRAGQLRTRLELQSASKAKNEFREMVRTWTTDAIVHAQVRLKSLGAVVEGEQSEALRNTQTAEIELRYRPGIDQTKRFKFGTNIYEIQGVQDPTGQRRTLIITAVVRVHDDNSVVVP